MVVAFQSSSVATTPAQDEAQGDVLLKEIAKRRMPAMLAVDEFDSIIMRNEQSDGVLSRIAGGQQSFSVLPDAFSKIARQLRSDLVGRDDATACVPLGADLVVRACLLSGAIGSHLLLLVENSRRGNAVESGLDRLHVTPRERDVAALVVQGLSNRVIAERLFLAEYTVQGYLKSIFAKASVRTRAALVAKLLGWTDPAPN